MRRSSAAGELTWSTVDTPLSSANPIQPFKHLMQRVDMEKQLDQLISEVKEEPKVEASCLAGKPLPRPARLMISRSLTSVSRR